VKEVFVQSQRKIHCQAERLTAAKAAHDAARYEASQAREEATMLRGQLQALQEIMTSDTKPTTTRREK